MYLVDFSSVLADTAEQLTRQVYDQTALPLRQFTCHNGHTWIRAIDPHQLYPDKIPCPACGADHTAATCWHIAVPGDPLSAYTTAIGALLADMQVAPAMPMQTWVTFAATGDREKDILYTALATAANNLCDLVDRLVDADGGLEGGIVRPEQRALMIAEAVLKAARREHDPDTCVLCRH